MKIKLFSRELRVVLAHAIKGNLVTVRRNNKTLFLNEVPVPFLLNLSLSFPKAPIKCFHCKENTDECF